MFTLPFGCYYSFYNPCHLVSRLFDQKNMFVTILWSNKFITITHLQFAVFSCLIYCIKTFYDCFNKHIIFFFRDFLSSHLLLLIFLIRYLSNTYWDQKYKLFRLISMNLVLYFTCVHSRIYLFPFYNINLHFTRII